MLGRTDSRARLLVLLLILVVAGLALVARLAWWQVARRDALAEQASRQTTLKAEVPSRRGSVYDRSGTVVLATTVDRDRLSATPDQLTAAQRRNVAKQLVAILKLKGEAATLFTTRMTTAKPYVVLARDLEPAQSEAIRAAIAADRISQVALEPESKREYPQSGGGPDSTLAAQLIGFVNRDGLGQYGVEQRYQDLLAGSPKVVLAQRDTASRLIPETSQVLEPGVPGADLRLTIDAGLQLAVEQEVFAAWLADKARSVSAVVMDPYTGEIYAESSYPSYDANDYRAIAADDPARFVDPVVTGMYEPGSVFKMLTVVAALDAKTVTPTTKIVDVGTLRLDDGRTKIRNADRRGMGTVEFQDGIAYSRNVVATKVALGLASTTAAAAAKLYATWTRLGFGQPTGIDVAGEASGILHDPAVRAWREIDIANGSFGQGVAVTPIQLATAYAAMVNGGTLLQPHVVKAISGDEVVPTSRGQVVDPAMVPTLESMMNHVVSTVPFYRDRTLIPGYWVGGKTGTAQIWDPKMYGGAGGWKEKLYNYSFVGFIGRQEGHPDLVIAVRIHEGTPNVMRVGHLEMPMMSFELFRRIATDGITTPGLLSDRPSAPGPAIADLAR